MTPVRHGGFARAAKRAALIIIPGTIGLILLCAAGLGILSALFKPADYQNLLADAVEKATGRHLAFYGNLEITFFPTLGLKTGRLTLNNPDSPAGTDLLSVESASVSVALKPLLYGVLEIEELLLSGVRVNLQVDPAGRNNWTSAKEQGTSDAGPDAVPVEAPPDAGGKGGGMQPTLNLKRVVCNGIAVSFRDLRGGGAYNADIDALTLTGLRDGTAAPLVLSGRARDDDNGSTLSFRMKAAVTMRAGKNAGTGEQTAGPSLYLDIAELELRPQIGNLNPITVELSGKTEFFISGAWTLEDSKGTLAMSGNNPAVPAAHFTAEAAYAPGRGSGHTLKGELALDSLDINALLRFSAPATGDSAGGVRGAPNLTRPTPAGTQAPSAGTPKSRDSKSRDISKRGKKGAPADDAARNPETSPIPSALRDSAVAFKVTVDKAVYGKVTLNGVRGDLEMRDGKADLAYALTLFRGRLSGRAALDLRGAELEPAVKAVLRDLDLADASPAFSVQYAISGTMKASLDLKCRGRSLESLLHSLAGKVSFTARDGEIRGFKALPDLPDFISLPASFAYKSISASAAVAQGEAVSKDIALLSDTLLARGGGTIHIAYGQADLGIDVMTAGPPAGPAVPVSVRGPLHALSYSIDTRTLLRNAAESAARTPEAAADLLKKSEETVKGLRDHLFPRR
ncbi:MAG: AsmA family protein [Desulfovibrio sp.]|jgi:AsmA protein|nr:AsmA family protein [Desulfovibrio sp.]